MERYSDEAIRILDDLHTERLDYHSEYLPLIDAAQRLDAYESTGMEPEDILNATDMAKVACALRELNQYKELGDLDRLRELVEADREGRCVVLPCKPSNVTVYQLRSKKHARGRGVSPCHVGCAVVWAGGHYALEHQGDEPCWERDFGKTWFLTPEAAEKALEEMEENENG